MPRYSPFECQEVEAYADAFSVLPGRTIEFSVSVKSPSSDKVLLEIFSADQIIVDSSLYGERADQAYGQDYRNFLSVRPHAIPHHAVQFEARSYPLPPNASQEGCSWPKAVDWRVPAALGSCVCMARFTYGGFHAYVIFVVLPGASRSRILCQLSVNTYQAYNSFGGYCLYGPPVSKGIRNPISFERPCQLWDYILYEAAILSWFGRNFSPDFCTNVDLHRDPMILAGYDLFVSCGHDEYWSTQMRDGVESFGRSGGNVLLLSGNTCYRPASFEGSHGSQMRRVTLESGDYGRPEAGTTGVNWCAGRWSKPLIKRGYVVRAPCHWVFENTGLGESDTFGEAEGIIGYETDAAFYNFQGKPTPPTPFDFATLATAELPEWDDWYGRAATMGMFRRDGKGIVLTTATTGWGRGLLTDSGIVDRITRNLVEKLRVRA